METFPLFLPCWGESSFSSSSSPQVYGRQDGRKCVSVPVPPPPLHSPAPAVHDRQQGREGGRRPRCIPLTRGREEGSRRLTGASPLPEKNLFLPLSTLTSTYALMGTFFWKCTWGSRGLGVGVRLFFFPFRPRRRGEGRFGMSVPPPRWVLNERGRGFQLWFGR